jgi:hypothetical protein
MSDITTLGPVIVTAPQNKHLPSAAASLALLQEGTREVGENWGPKVQAFLAAANVHTPNPWCAAFVNWCAEQEAAKLGVKSPLELVPNQAYVQSYVDYGKAHGWVIPTKDAKAGDLICFFHKSEGRYAHIGFVTGWKDGQIMTIEGNTNDEGSREGYEVAKRLRTVTSGVLILRWA